MKLRDVLSGCTVWIAAAALLVAAIPGAPDLLIYRREAVLDGQLWRLLTGHLVHATSYHLIWDVLPLLVLGALFERALGSGYWKLMGGSALLISAGMLCLQPDLPAYCGLSGVLNGLWVGGALVAAADERTSGRVPLARLYEAAVLLSLGKLGYEAWAGASLFSDPGALGALPVPLAHALGSLAGVVCAMRKSREQPPAPSLTSTPLALTRHLPTMNSQEVTEPCSPTLSTCSASSTGCSAGSFPAMRRVTR